MKETIILAPGLNGNELLQTLAKYHKNTMGIRVMNGAELARFALLRSGVSVSEKFIDSREESRLITLAVDGESYFLEPRYSDILEITQAIRKMRSLLPVSNEAEEEAELKAALEAGSFTEKNTALYNIYRKYMGLLYTERAVDAVGLIRKAIQSSKTLPQQFIVLEEYPLNPLERALLEKVTGQASVVSLSLPELFEAAEKKLHIREYRNGYGASNEVEAILDTIYKNYDLDTCTVALADPGRYGQLFLDKALELDIPMTFDCGLSLVNSNPGKLLVLYKRWMSEGFFGCEVLQKMIFSEAFDRRKLEESLSSEPFLRTLLYKTAGTLRLTNNAETNRTLLSDFWKGLSEEEKIAEDSGEKALKAIQDTKSLMPLLVNLSNELSLSPADFIRKYAYIRKGSASWTEKLLMQLDMMSEKKIYNELGQVSGEGISLDAVDILENAAQMTVKLSGTQAGAIHITTIPGGLTSIRENIFIAGLTANAFPGKPSENYLLLDEDLRLLDKELNQSEEISGRCTDRITSEGKVNRKREQLFDLLRLSSALESRIYLSFAGMNAADLGKNNSSSVLYEIFCMENGEASTVEDLEKEIIETDYFEPDLSPLRGVGRAYNAGKQVLSGEKDIPNPAVRDMSGFTAWALNKTYSPSSLENFFGCERSFMLNSLLRIPEPEEEKIFEIISAADKGTLAHALMESLSEKNYSEQDFLKLCEDRFDWFILQHPAALPGQISEQKKSFMDMMKTAYGMDPKREVTVKEEDICGEHPTGIRLHGYPDRVEKLDNGKLQIVDFKSGRSLKHLEDDPDTCLQVLIYAFLMENRGDSIVESGEYRYIARGDTVICHNDQDRKDALSDKLEYFHQALEKAVFPAAEEDSDACKYCKYASICRIGDGPVLDKESTKGGDL